MTIYYSNISQRQIEVDLLAGRYRYLDTRTHGVRGGEWHSFCSGDLARGPSLVAKHLRNGDWRLMDPYTMLTEGL